MVFIVDEPHNIIPFLADNYAREYFGSDVAFVLFMWTEWNITYDDRSYLEVMDTISPDRRKLHKHTRSVLMILLFWEGY